MLVARGDGVNYIFLNLKRFDIEPRYGGVNRIAPAREWGGVVASALRTGLAERPALAGWLAVAAFLPEAHIPGAIGAIDAIGAVNMSGASVDLTDPRAFSMTSAPSMVVTPGIGCQSVHFEDATPGGNFGAFTTLRTASAMRQLGCGWTIIGHSEERKNLAAIMTLAGARPEAAARAISELLGAQVRAAQKVGLRVLFCVGETAEQVPARREVLARQVEEGLGGADMANVVLAYEPVWAIGPGKTPPSAREIADIAADIKRIAACPLVYGGGLKKENAASIGAIDALDGGLVALTRFSGDIGFYPGEFFGIVDLYARGAGINVAGAPSRASSAAATSQEANG